MSTKVKAEPDTEECLTLNVSVQNNRDLEKVCPTTEVLGQFDRINYRMRCDCIEYEVYSIYDSIYTILENSKGSGHYELQKSPVCCRRSIHI